MSIWVGCAVAMSLLCSARRVAVAQTEDQDVLETSCERINSSGDWRARISIANISEQRVSFRIEVGVRGSGDAFHLAIVEHALDPGANLVRELAPFPSETSISNCHVNIVSTSLSAPRIRHTRRVLGGLLMGQLTGGLGGVVATVLAVTAARLDWWDCYRTECLHGTLLAMYTGYVLGLPFGVKHTGDHHGGGGSYWASLLASAVGGAVGVYAIRRSGWSRALVPLYLAMPTLTASAGYWLSHRATGAKLAPSVSLLELRDGELAAGVPLIWPTREAGVTIIRLLLVAGRF